MVLVAVLTPYYYYLVLYSELGTSSHPPMGQQLKESRLISHGSQWACTGTLFLSPSLPPLISYQALAPPMCMCPFSFFLLMPVLCLA